MAETLASLPLIVGGDGDVRQRAQDAWQYQLLHEKPNAQQKVNGKSDSKLESVTGSASMGATA